MTNETNETPDLSANEQMLADREAEATAQVEAEANETETAFEEPAAGHDVPLPEGLGEQWEGKSVADLMKAQADAQAKITELSQEDTGDVSEEEEGDDKETEVTTDTTLDKFNDLYVEQGGKLTEDQLTEASKDLGMPQETVDVYFQGLRAIAQLAAYEVYDSVGGEANFKAMDTWADKNLDEGAKKQYSEAIASNDVDKIKFAIEAVEAKFRAANGAAPVRQVQLQGSVPQGSEGFKSEAELVEAMEDPRWESSKPYKEAVMRRLSMSTY